MNQFIKNVLLPSTILLILLPSLVWSAVAEIGPPDLQVTGWPVDGAVGAEIDLVATGHNVDIIVILDNGRYASGATGCKDLDVCVATYSDVLDAGTHKIEVRAAPSYLLGDDLESLVQTRTFYFEDRAREEDSIPGTVVGTCEKSNIQTGSAVNVINGYMTQEIPLISTPGTLGLNFSLYYRSNNEAYIPYNQGFDYAYKRLLGQGWSHNYDLYLHRNDDGTIVLTGGNIREAFFYRQADGTYLPQEGGSLSLHEKTTDVFSVETRQGTIYDFDAEGFLSSITDKYGNTSIIARSNSYFRVFSPAGKVLKFYYDSSIYKNRITKVIDSNGEYYYFTYDDTTGLLTKIKTPANNEGQQAIWEFAYNDQRLMETKTEPGGQIFTYTYDSEKRAIAVIDPNMGSKTFSYSGNSTTVTDKNGGEWIYDFDPTLAKITKETKPNGFVTHYFYDSNGHLSQKVEKLEPNLERHTYFNPDEYGNNQNVTLHLVTIDGYDAKGIAINPVVGQAIKDVSYIYDEQDRVTQITNNLTGEITTAVYDIDGSYYREIYTDPLGNTTSTRRNSDGTIYDTTDANGLVTTYAYDTGGLLKTITSPDGSRVEFSNRTTSGRPKLISIYDGNNTLLRSTTIQYDDLDQMVRQTETGGVVSAETSIKFDLSGNIKSSTDPEGNITTTEFNFENQATRVVDAMLQDTQFEYEHGKYIKAVVDSKGNRTEYEYNLMWQLVKETDPLGNSIRYEYYPCGKLWKKIDDTTGSVLLSLEYDGAGRMLKRTWADGNIDTFTYIPGTDRVLTATNNHIAYTFEYYANGWVQSVTDSRGHTINHDQYDGAGQRMLTTLLDGSANEFSVTYGYDSLKRLNSLQTTFGTASLTYDASGRRSTLTHPNGVSTAYGFDNNMGHLTSITHNGVTTIGYPTHDLVGNRKAKTIDGQQTDYGYDDVYRLLTATGANNENYTYDEVGNREFGPAGTDSPYSYNAGNQLDYSPLGNFGYDHLGNQITRPVAGGGVWTQTWTSNNQLETATLTGGTDPMTVSFKYDPFGRRIEKKVETVIDASNVVKTFTYVYDAEDIIAEFLDVTIGGVAQPQVVSRYLHGPGIDEPLLLNRSGQTYSYHADGLGSIVALTDSAGQVVETYSYDSFGRATSSGAFEQPYGYTGRENDTETGLMYYRARYYDPLAGRWISRDPISFSGGDTNLYGYVGQNPVRYSDPSGEIEWEGTLTGVSAIKGLGAGGFYFDLTSECKSGSKVRIKGYVAAVAAGVGLKYAGTGSKVSFYDYRDTPDPMIANGGVAILSGGLAAGGEGHGGKGYSLSKMTIGHLYSDLGFGKTTGVDASAAFYLGASLVTDYEYMSCEKECKQ